MNFASQGSVKCPVIAITNQKGGVGKTTTAMNLAGAFAAIGKRVLAIDSDPHGNLTQGLGVSIRELTVGLKNLIEDRARPTHEAILKTSAGIDLIGSNPELVQVVRRVMHQTNGELRLRQRIAALRDSYDLIFIDSCPGLGSLLNSTLNAADRIIIPVDPGFYGYMGVQELQNEVEEIRLGTNPSLSILGFVLTMTERTVIARETFDTLVARFGDHVFETKIRRCVSLRESPVIGKTVFEYAPSSIGATDYGALAVEVFNRLESSAFVNEVIHA